MINNKKINYLTTSIFAQKNTKTIALKMIAITNVFLNNITDFIITGTKQSHTLKIYCNNLTQYIYSHPQFVTLQENL